jgi:hypothetical protein
VTGMRNVFGLREVPNEKIILVKYCFFEVYTYGWLKKKRELSEKVLSDFIKFL